MVRTFHSRDANDIMIAFVESEYPYDYDMQDDLMDLLIHAFANDENPDLQGQYYTFREQYLQSIVASVREEERVQGNALLLGAIGVVVGFGVLQRQIIYNYIHANISEQMINILGFTGGFLQLGAVLAVSRGRWSNTSNIYHLTSLIGSSGLLLNAFYYGANPAVVINIIWMSMNLVGLKEGVSNWAVLDDWADAFAWPNPRPVLG